MSQHDFNLANASGPNFRADANAALAALATLSAGATAPTPTFANQLWYDTSIGYLKKRDNANTTWQVLFSLDASGNWTFKPGANDRNIDLQNATSQVVARLRADTGGDGRLFVEDRNSTTRFMAHAPTTGGALYLDGDESTGKQVLPLKRTGTYNLAGLTGQTVTGLAGAQELVIAFRALQFANNASPLVQLGTSGGLASAGYVSTSGTIVNGQVGAGSTAADGFNFRAGNANQPSYGVMYLVHLGDNTWSAMHGGTHFGQATAGGGAISLAGALTQLRLGSGGATTFSTGTFSVLVRY